jgi:hypothetical protein
MAENVESKGKIGTKEYMISTSGYFCTCCIMGVVAECRAYVKSKYRRLRDVMFFS